MIKRTFTVYSDDDSIYCYLFDVTRIEAQNEVNRINEETGKHHYYMDGFFNK